MKKAFLNLEGVAVLSKSEQKNILAGNGVSVGSEADKPICSDMSCPIPLGYPKDQGTCYFLYGGHYYYFNGRCVHHN